MICQEINQFIDQALDARQGLVDEEHLSAFRLFNGFYEGCPELAIDIYARTLILHDYGTQPASHSQNLQDIQQHIFARLPWLQSAVVKRRAAQKVEERRGILTYGQSVDDKVLEGGTWYAIDPLLNRDASLYLDTRNLRHWAQAHLAGKTVLNTFAYTGSLGVAALAGGASRVVQVDQNQEFLNLARKSYLLNSFPLRKTDFLRGDFWLHTSRMRRAGVHFDCVMIDPPFFASSAAGTVDLEHSSTRLINKVRPLAADHGWLVAINNALYVSGADYLHSLEALCAEGYMQIEELIPVPQDFTGTSQTICSKPPVDPSPFNHPTKIAILKVFTKS